MSGLGRQLMNVDVAGWPVEMDQPLTDEEQRHVHILEKLGRGRLLNAYRERCRELRLSSLGVLFPELRPELLARALVLMNRPPAPLDGPVGVPVIVPCSWIHPEEPAECRNGHPVLIIIC